MIFFTNYSKVSFKPLTTLLWRRLQRYIIDPQKLVMWVAKLSINFCY